MSLALTATQSCGVDATFWTLNSIFLDVASQSAVIKVDGYISEAARTDGKDPLVTKDITIIFVPTNILPSVSVLQALYSRIILDAYFVGAVYTNDGV